MTLLDEMSLAVATSPALTTAMDFALSVRFKPSQHDSRRFAPAADPVALRHSREVWRVPLIRLLLVLLMFGVAPGR